MLMTNEEVKTKFLEPIIDLSTSLIESESGNSYELSNDADVQRLYAFAILCYLRDCLIALNPDNQTTLVVEILTRSIYEAVVKGIVLVNDIKFYKRLDLSGFVSFVKTSDFIISNSEFFGSDLDLQQVITDREKINRVIETQKLKGDKEVQNMDTLASLANKFIKSDNHWYKMIYSYHSDNATHLSLSSINKYLAHSEDDIVFLKKDPPLSLEQIVITSIISLMFLRELSEKFKLGYEKKFENLSNNVKEYNKLLI